MTFPKSWQPFVVPPAPAPVSICKATTALCLLEADPGCSGLCRFHWALGLFLHAAGDLQARVEDVRTRNDSERAVQL